MDYIKVDTSTMKTVTSTDVIYDINELVQKKKGIEDYRDYMVNQWNTEIDAVNVLIAEAKKLGIKEPVVVAEPVIPE